MPSRKGTTLWISELPFDKWELPSNDCLHDVRERLALVTLNDLEYLKALEQAAAAGIHGLRGAHRALRIEGERADDIHLEHQALQPPRREGRRARQATLVACRGPMR
jgi:hypothetical protein